MIVVLLILLWALSACYFTRLFSRIRMKLAAVACATLYIGITGWILFVIVLGVFDLGTFANESLKTLATGWDISKSLNAFLGTAGTLPPGIMTALLSIADLIVVVGFFVVFADCFIVIRKAYLTIKKKMPDRAASRFTRSAPITVDPHIFVLRLRMFCRANC